jgi:Zn-dependent peptidase ImmA (M78 family)/transcriptional regulator with XRE-family HTH domain
VTIGRNLRNARRYLRLSQTTVANFARTSRQVVAAIEKDQKAADLNQLAAMANLYRLTLDELVGVRSAVAPQIVGRAMLPRLTSSKDLDEDDRRELAAFEEYLKKRPHSKGLPFAPKELEPITLAVSRVREVCKITDVAPVPVFAMCAKFGIEIRFTALGSLAGALMLATDEHPPGILVNSDQPFERQRFSAAHELGHFLLKHPTTEGGFVSFLGRRFEPEEVDADTFAGELLIPADLLKNRLKDVADRAVEEAVLLLARAFAVSFQAMTTRLVKLGALRPAKMHSLEKAKPAEISKRLDVEAGRTINFDRAWLPTIAKQAMPSGWHQAASPDVVRTLQESAFLHYLMKVPEGQAATSAGAVYEYVARWVAEKYPLVPT